MASPFLLKEYGNFLFSLVAVFMILLRRNKVQKVIYEKIFSLLWQISVYTSVCKIMSLLGNTNDF